MEINFLDYLVEEAYILIPALYIIGMLLKRTPRIADWLIPWILLLLGMLGGFFCAQMQPAGILQGIIVTGVTVFANQIYKQTAIKSKADPPKR